MTREPTPGTRGAEQVTFVVEAHGDINAYDTRSRAAASMEAQDVEDGEYPLICTVEGERLAPRLLDSVRVALNPTGEIDRTALVTAIRTHATRNRILSDPTDPGAVAQELLSRQRRQRPQRARWRRPR